MALILLKALEAQRRP